MRAPLQATTALPSAGRDLEITALRAHPVREPVSGRAYIILKLQTRSGLTGYGECAAASAAEVERARHIVTGMQATAYEVLRRLLAPLPRLEAAVNMALLDLVGKFAKAPVYQVLGGPTRNKVRALTALAGDSPPTGALRSGGPLESTLTAAMKQARDAGYRAFLVPLPPIAASNQGQAFVHATVRRLEALRAESERMLRVAGDDVDFVLDGAASLSPADAAGLSAALEGFHLLWFDEPCRLANLGAVRKLAAERVTPLGFGRDIHQGGGFQDLLREEAADVLRPSLALNGITQIRRVAALAETYYTAVAPFHDGGPIATAAALHLAASLPNFYIQQVPLPAAEADRRMRAEIAPDRPGVEAVVDGFAALPTAPGLGVTVSDAALEKYRT